MTASSRLPNGDGSGDAVGSRQAGGDSTVALDCLSWLKKLRGLNAVITASLKPYRLTLGEYELLAALEDGPLPQHGLCHATLHAEPSVSRWLAHLRQEGWVSRHRPPADLRTWMAALTDDGRRQLKAARATLTGVLESLDAALSPSERRTLVRLRSKLGRFVDSQRPES